MIETSSDAMGIGGALRVRWTAALGCVARRARGAALWYLSAREASALHGAHRRLGEERLAHYRAAGARIADTADRESRA